MEQEVVYMIPPAWKDAQSAMGIPVQHAKVASTTMVPVFAWHAFLHARNVAMQLLAHCVPRVIILILTMSVPPAKLIVWSALTPIAYCVIQAISPTPIPVMNAHLLVRNAPTQ